MLIDFIWYKCEAMNGELNCSSKYISYFVIIISSSNFSSYYILMPYFFRISYFPSSYFTLFYTSVVPSAKGKAVPFCPV